MTPGAHQIPDDPDELLRALAETAEEQRLLTARLDEIKGRRNSLVAAVRDRKLRTWKEIAALFGMTETALQIASRGQRGTRGQ